MSEIKRIKSLKEYFYFSQKRDKDWKMSFWGRHTWTDGKNIYLSDNTTKQFVLNKRKEWEQKTWNGTMAIWGDQIVVHKNIIFQLCNKQFFILDKETDTWEEYPIKGDIPNTATGSRVWLYKDKIIYSNGTNHYVLDLEDYTWKRITEWNTSFFGDRMWKDNNNTIYTSNGDNQSYFLDEKTNKWVRKDFSIPVFGQKIWKDNNNNIFLSANGGNYIFNNKTKDWEKIAINIIIDNGNESITDDYDDIVINGQEIWRDFQNNIYYTNNFREINQYSNCLKIDNFFIKDLKHENKNDFHNLKIEDKQFINNGKKYLINNKKPLIQSSRQVKRKYFETDQSFSSSLPYDVKYGEQIFYFNNKPYYLEKTRWSPYIYEFDYITKNFNRFSSLFPETSSSAEGRNVWSDGKNIYYKLEFQINKLEKSSVDIPGVSFTWPISNDFRGEYVWTDGKNIYYDAGSDHLILDKETKTWSNADWEETFSFYSNDIWTDGYNIYAGKNHKLNISEHKWETIDGSGANAVNNFNGYYIWSDGKDIYHTAGSRTFILDINSHTWKETYNLFKGYNGTYYGCHIWTDGYKTYMMNKDQDGSSSYPLVLKEVETKVKVFI